MLTRLTKSVRPRESVSVSTWLIAMLNQTDEKREAERISNAQRRQRQRQHRGGSGSAAAATTATVAAEAEAEAAAAAQLSCSNDSSGDAATVAPMPKTMMDSECVTRRVMNSHKKDERKTIAVDALMALNGGDNYGSGSAEKKPKFIESGKICVRLLNNKQNMRVILSTNRIFD